MKYSNLGETDLKVSKICLGTMTFGEQNTEAEAHAQLNLALEQGINFIDTAELYAIPPKAENNGLTEQYIGTWLKDRKDRDQIILASKIAGPSPRLSFIRPDLNFQPQSIRIALEGSLKRLQTDYLDLYQLHWPERRTNFFGHLEFKYSESDPWTDNFQEVLETMQALINEGKIRHFGISNETPWGLSRFVQLSAEKGLPKSVSIQNPYSLLNRSFEVGLAEMAIREKVGLLAYSPMAFGMLSGKYHRGPEPINSRLSLYKAYNRYSNTRSKEATAQYIDIADQYGLSPAKLALAFVHQQPFLTSTIIGATSLEQLKENIESIDIELSKDVLKEINAVHLQNPNPAP